VPSEAAIVIVRDSRNRILFLRRSVTCPKYPLHWGLPGGYLDPGETPVQAAVRELREETGLHLGQSDLVPKGSSRAGGGIHVFEARSPEVAPVSSDGEHDGFVWAALSSLPYPLAPGVKDMLYSWEA